MYHEGCIVFFLISSKFLFAFVSRYVRLLFCILNIFPLLYIHLLNLVIITSHHFNRQGKSLLKCDFPLCHRIQDFVVLVGMVKFWGDY